jgi:UDP-N-acetylmuramate dehydrogenase
MLNFKENISLSDYTTIKLGGKARYFCECIDEDEIIECLNFIGENELKYQILGGGSNIIFPDEGFEGLILKTAMKNINLTGKGGSDEVEVIAEAGVNWDDFVRFCVAQGFAGIECLSGIPGTVGATPIQNVGAYGQDVSQVIVEVNAIEIDTLNKVKFSNADCRFGYRKSRFKSEDSNKYIITEVKFSLKRNGEPLIQYPDLIKSLNEKNYLLSNDEGKNYFKDITDSKEKLKIVRDAIIEIRKRKGMVTDENDPDSVSCGSFFTNPILSEEEFKTFKDNCIKKKISDIEIPHFKTDKGIKVPAAWLIENAGFKKGYKKNGAGISSKHTLALINCGGKTKDVIALANEICEKVFELFGIKLETEPQIINYSGAASTRF